MSVPCDVREGLPDGISKTQEKMLKKRGKRTATEVEKWIEMYQIIFPHVPVDQIPSPCKGSRFLVDTSAKCASLVYESEEMKLVLPSLDVIQQHLENHLPKLIKEKIFGHAGVLGLNSNLTPQVTEHIVRGAVMESFEDLFKQTRHEQGLLAAASKATATSEISASMLSISERAPGADYYEGIPYGGDDWSEFFGDAPRSLEPLSVDSAGDSSAYSGSTAETSRKLPVGIPSSNGEELKNGDARPESSHALFATDFLSPGAWQ